MHGPLDLFMSPIGMFPLNGRGFLCPRNPEHVHGCVEALHGGHITEDAASNPFCFAVVIVID